MKNKSIYQSEAISELLNLSTNDLKSIDCQSVTILQQTNKNGTRAVAPRLIMTSTNGKQTTYDGYDTIDRACKHWLRIIAEKKSPMHERISNLIQSHLAGVKVTYLENEQYKIEKVADGISIRLTIPEKNIYHSFAIGMTEGEIAKQLIGAIKDEFLIQSGSNRKRFYFNGVFWMTEKTKNGPLEIMSADEVMVMMQNTTAGQWLSNGKFESRHDIRTWTADQSYEYVLNHVKSVDSLIGKDKPDNTAGQLEFKDVSTEIYRVYEFPDGKIVKINKPVKLNVSKSGGHRILDEKGVSHYVPSGWVHLYWKVKDGMEPFSF